MSTCNSEGVAEFIRLLEDLLDFVEDMTEYERKFIEDNWERAENYGDKTTVTETQLEFARKLYTKLDL